MECAQLLEELEMKAGVNGRVDLWTSFETFKDFTVKVQENKTSSPSGRHYGHYKVLAMEEDLLTVVYDVMALDLERGIVLERWWEVHQVLLLKDPPRSKVHIFRNIMLVEGDLMFIMKDVWAKKFRGKIYREGLLNEAQYA